MATRKDILLKNGRVIVHGVDDTAKAILADVLVQGNKITQIEPHIAAPAGADVDLIDCTDKLVAPGFVDTHRHMYTIALRGRHGDDMLNDYLVRGILQSSNYEPNDIFWGQLAGSLECINAGTTTVVDHSHLNYGKEYPKAAIAATIASGLRSIYGYCFNIRVDSWHPFSLNPSFIAPWALENLQMIAQQRPLGDGRVTLGIAFDGWFLPKEILKPLFDKIRSLGIKHLTTHNSPSPPGVPTAVETMEAVGVLTPLSILAHANRLSQGDVALIKRCKAKVSSTPSLELQMAMGVPACFDETRDVQACSSLGIDCHNATLASIPAEMRMALQSSRGTFNDRILEKGKVPARVYKSVQEVYALGTISGARAIGMEDQIGSLAVGKTADIIVLDAVSPNMICGAQYDPVTAIVMHSTPADVVTTIIDGVVRKRNGRLEPVHVTPELRSWTRPQSTLLYWEDVIKEVLKSRDALQDKLDKIDYPTAKKAAMQAFGMDESIVVDVPPTSRL
ncbi:uncharacterized protein PV07_09975 [Cladophialophora immunda]|uniref:Amidohydrolase-related domain-containing protein n=1 Tax=Cladophialophora immunda TaxID=569365 RepID=A0A0D2AH90_9EURO|nr:uncharacterized protein PV07_09975 [Cladophialophora immunda]KIW24247.1 hypothetical protein PV07_09975 [Cladophialophora immunda]OQV07555.1 hypothetical protein CLAIMM_11971 [Cladophialophora immunda]